MTGNTFHECTQEISSGGSAAVFYSDATFEYNVVSNCTGATAVSLNSDSDLGHTLETSHNIFIGNVNGNYGNHSPAPTDWVIDPQFCDPLTGDFSVAASSPCLPANNPATCTIRIGARDAGCPSLGTTVVALTANTFGPYVIGDGTQKAAPALFNLPIGSSPVISANAFQNHVSGEQYTFSSWSDGGAISHAITVPAAFTEVMATFGIEYSLAVSAIGQGTVPSGEWVPAGETRPLLAVPDVAWEFSFWDGTGDGAVLGSMNPIVPTLNGPITQTATFTRTHFDLTMSADSAGVVTPASGLQLVGAVVSIDATADSGYVFSGWTGTGTGSYSGPFTPRTVTMHSALTETAHFDPLLAMIAGPGGSVTPGDGPHSPGSAVEIEAIADTRHVFRSWTGSGIGSYTGSESVVTIAMVAPITQTAQFEEIAYEVTLSLSDTDPNVSAGSPIGLGNVYLWLDCGTAGGISTLQAEVVGSMDTIVFTPVAGILNGGSSQQLNLVTANCVTGPALLGHFTVLPPGEGSLCLTGTTVSNCALPADQFAWPEDLKVTGVQTDGGVPCSFGRGCNETTLSGSTPVGAPAPVVVVRYPDELIGSFPNPFVQSTSIRFSLERTTRVTLSVFDVSGRRIRDLVSGDRPAGSHEVAWGGRDANGQMVSSGIFFVRMVTGDYTDVQRLVLLR